MTTEVLHAQDGGAHVLRYRGEVRYPATPAVARFVREMIDRDAPSALVIDLTDVSIIDSTNLGHIARVGQELRARGADFVIVSPNEDVTEVLRSMAFDRVFAVVTDPPPAAGEDGDGAGVETERVPLGGRANAAELKETVLEAHRCLLDLSEDNRVLFEEVVSMLEACEQKRKTQAE
ncbi:MAG: STAS domain-containing protein [Myxococcales bacterium]|nr:STAS domain-containing protein [Myxococcales bacterium]MCB9733102.1 STAS domain-containing protein [Deltaproteobacteria bacterium]